MKDLQEATVKICELYGENLAIMALLSAVIETLPQGQVDQVFGFFDATVEAARATMGASAMGDEVITGFEQTVESMNELR